MPNTQIFKKINLYKYSTSERPSNEQSENTKKYPYQLPAKELFGRAVKDAKDAVNRVLKSKSADSDYLVEEPVRVSSDIVKPWGNLEVDSDGIPAKQLKAPRLAFRHEIKNTEPVKTKEELLTLELLELQGKLSGINSFMTPKEIYELVQEAQSHADKGWFNEDNTPVGTILFELSVKIEEDIRNLDPDIKKKFYSYKDELEAEVAKNDPGMKE